MTTWSRTWWTKERVLAGLKRFHLDRGLVPTSSEEWDRLTGIRGGSSAGFRRRRYPSIHGVLGHFSTFREAWEAAGVDVDRWWEPWTELEEWYLAEAIGIIPREEIARDLKRSDAAVKRRLYDLDLKITEARGWSVHRLEKATGVKADVFRRYMEWGDLPFLRGTKVVYIDPADLTVVEELDFDHLPKDLEEAMVLSLRGRLVKVLAGQDWRAGRLHHAQRTIVGRFKDTTNRRHGLKPVPRPNAIAAGDWVRAIADVPGRPNVVGRVGLVHLVYAANAKYSYTRTMGTGALWMARVEFKSERNGPVRTAPRVTYSLPLEILVRAEQTLNRRCTCGALIFWRSDEPAPIGCAFCARELEELVG